MTFLQNLRMIIVIILLLLIRSNAQKTDSKRKTDSILGEYNKITLKFSETGTLKVLNDGILNIFGTQKLSLQDLNSQGQIDNLSNCSKTSGIISCTIPTTKSIQIEISEEVVNLKRFFFETQASEIIFKESWENTKIEQMEEMCLNATLLTKIDISNLNTDELVSINSLFSGCSILKSITFGNINTSKIKNFEYIFYSCSQLTSVKLTAFNTSQVVSMSYMFYYCINLRSLDLSTFDTSKVNRSNDLKLMQ